MPKPTICAECAHHRAQVWHGVVLAHICLVTPITDWRIENYTTGATRGHYTGRDGGECTTRGRYAYCAHINHDGACPFFQPQPERPLPVSFWARLRRWIGRAA